MRFFYGLLLTGFLLFASGDAPGADTAAAASARFDIEVVDAPARAFFMGLAARGGENLLVHADVKGNVTLTLKQVNVAEVLLSVRELYGYDFRRLPTAWFVLPATERTQFFTVNYLDMARTGSSRTMVSSGSIAESGANKEGNTTASTTAGSTADGGATGTNGTIISSQTQTDFWGQLEANLKSIVGADADRRVIVNRQSGVVAVRAMPDDLRSVGDYLQRVQTTVTRQVVLEAKILEVELSDAFQAGINWATVLRGGPDTFAGGVASPPKGFDEDLLKQPGRNVTIGPRSPFTQFATTTLGGAFTLAVDTADFSAMLDLLKTQGDTRVLSSPRVATLHNQKAVIKAGTDELFVTNVTSSTVTGTATSSSREVELTPFFSGIALDVTPQIGDNGDVILHVHPSVSEVRDQTKRLTVNGQTDELPLAVSEIRESDSVVRAHNGQLIVIGGMMRSSKDSRDFSTPFLSAIPVLGNLFKSKRDVSRKTELVILLKATVIGGDDPATLVSADAALLKEMEAQLK